MKHWRRVVFTRTFALWTMLIAAWIYRGFQSFDIRDAMDAVAVGIAIGILLFIWMIPLALSYLIYALWIAPVTNPATSAPSRPPFG